MLFLNNFEHQAKQVVRYKCMLECAKLIKYYAEGPNIALRCVRLTLTRLGAHVVRCADHCHGCRIRVLQYPRNAEIAQFDSEVAGQENVLRF